MTKLFGYFPLVVQLEDFEGLINAKLPKKVEVNEKEDAKS